MILKNVAEDLKGKGINPLPFQGDVDEVLELCRQKAIDEFGYVHVFTRESSWRRGFWDRNCPPSPKGILELADSSE